MICCTYLIECDGGCGATVSDNHSAADLDRYATGEGWKLSRNGDLCPTCAPTSGAWALVERAQAGDAEAFGHLYDRYLDVVFRFVYYRVGNRQLAEDLTADTFCRALRRIGSLQWQGSDPSAWLVTIARNLVADHFKSGRYRLEVTSGDVLDGEKEDKAPGPEQAAGDYLTNRALWAAVKQLTEDQRNVIVCRFLRGLNVAETAEKLGSTIGAVKACQYRAVLNLARLVPELGENAEPRHPPRTPKQRRRQVVTCDNCHRPLDGLLAECDLADCVKAVNEVEWSVIQ